MTQGLYTYQKILTKKKKSDGEELFLVPMTVWDTEKVLSTE